MRARALALLAAVLASACGGPAVFRLSSDENNPYALGQALQRRQLPATAAPTNAAARPRVFVVTTGAPRTLVAYDLASGTALWKVDADVQSRIAVGGDFVVAREGAQIVARDQARGAPRWRAPVRGTFVGLAADRERAYVVSHQGTTWWLTGLAGDDGRALWQADAIGELGVPAAHGGVVYVPFLRQWLSLVDGATGRQLTRIRGIDEQIAMLRVTSQVAYYGSARGVFVLDGTSASGTRADAAYGQVTIPRQLEGATYGTDAYDPVQASYTALDRKRVLWPPPHPPANAGYAIHYFRFVLGFGAGGAVRWAYSHPRVDLVASEHTGAVIAAVAANGDVVALDPATGAVRARTHLGGTAQVLGATFDADGWAPAAAAAPAATVDALVAIVRDREARFDRVKDLALRALAAQPGPAVTRHLLEVLADPRAPAAVKDTVVELLVARRDPASLPVLAAQLAVRTDYLAGTEPQALAAVAKVIGSLRGVALDPAHVAPALAALQAHLEAPTTTPAELVEVIRAMAAIGAGAEHAALASHLLLYHADDGLGDDAGWQQTIVVAVGQRAPAARETLRYVADDPRTRPALAARAREALAGD